MEQPNLSYVHNMSGGDKDFEQKLISIIKGEFPEEKKIYFENISSNNFILTAANVHKIKHKIGILGLEKSYELAVAYETELLEGKTKLRTEFESVLNIMTHFLNDL